MLSIFFFLIFPPPPTSTLFPYTTLFRSAETCLAQIRSTVSAFSENAPPTDDQTLDRKSTRLNSSHITISYAVFCLKKKKISDRQRRLGSARLRRRLRPARHIGRTHL